MGGEEFAGDFGEFAVAEAVGGPGDFDGGDGGLEKFTEALAMGFDAFEGGLADELGVEVALLEFLDGAGDAGGVGFADDDEAVVPKDIAASFAGGRDDGKAAEEVFHAGEHRAFDFGEAEADVGLIEEMDDFGAGQ